MTNPGSSLYQIVPGWKITSYLIPQTVMKSITGQSSLKKELDMRKPRNTREPRKLHCVLDAVSHDSENVFCG